MRALITGATGFLGSHLAELLVSEGASVAVLMRPGSDPWRIHGLLPRVESIRGDLNDLSACESEISRFSPDVIYHLGWNGVPSKYRNDDRQVQNNINATVGLARLAGRVGCGKIVGLGSQAEYGPQTGPLSETAANHPTTFYGAAKLAAYHLSRVTLSCSDVRFVWVRLFSCYGQKDNPDWLIPSLIGSLLSGKRPPLTAAEQVWDYVHVTDAARAISLVGSCEAAEGVFNLGSGKAVRLRHIVESVRDLIDPSLALGFGEVPYRADQVMHLEADVSRLESTTGWMHQVTLQDGLAQTVSWFRARASAKCG